MWLFTKHGFFSAVCARQGDGGHGQPVDPERIMVRARVRGHLEALKSRFPAELGNCQIVESPDADYPFRLFVGKPEWARVLAGLAEETDYDNFKSEVERFQGVLGRDYERALHAIWGIARRLKDHEALRWMNKTPAEIDAYIAKRAETDPFWKEIQDSSARIDQ